MTKFLPEAVLLIRHIYYKVLFEFDLLKSYLYKTVIKFLKYADACICYKYNYSE